MLGFDKCTMRSWTGRYPRIPGDGTVFHVKQRNGRWWPMICWQRDNEKAWCPALDQGDVEELADSVNEAKRSMGSWQGGGCFIINEFGQVIVPSPDGEGRRLLVGEISGRFLFKNSFDGNGVIDLGDTDNLTCGDSWPWPYIGNRYHLSKKSLIYYWHTDQSGGRMGECPWQPKAVIGGLRRIRRAGGKTFIVTYRGDVVTRRPPAAGTQGEDESWPPVYVCKLNLDRWFKKEL